MAVLIEGRKGTETGNPVKQGQGNFLKWNRMLNPPELNEILLMAEIWLTTWDGAETL